MKLISSMFAVLFILVVLSGHRFQMTEDIQEVSFSTLSRGGHYEQIVITEDKVTFEIEERRSSEEKEVSSRKLKELEWKELIRSAEHLDLQRIPELKSPSMKRAYDGARHSEIVIRTFDNQQYVHRFDDEDPNTVLKALLQSMLKLKAVD